MNEYLYILFLVAWLAFSVYQQSQKKKRKEAAKRVAMQEEDANEYDTQHQPVEDAYVERPVEGTKGKTDFKRALEEILLGEQISLETIPDEEAQSLETIPERGYVAENEKEAHTSAWSGMEKQSPESVAKMKDDLDKNMVLNEDTMEDESTEHYFNLRNAVIYAEILKPKYVN